MVERASALSTGGQAIDLRGTAREVVQRMALMDDIRKAHTGTHGMASVNSAGKWLSTMDSDLFGDSGGVIAEIEILRGDLVRILYSHLRGCGVLFDDSIAGLTQGNDGIDVTFEVAHIARLTWS